MQGDLKERFEDGSMTTPRKAELFLVSTFATRTLALGQIAETSQAKSLHELAGCQLMIGEPARMLR